MIIDQGDPFAALDAAEKRAAASGMGLPGPRFVHVTTDCWFRLQLEWAKRDGTKPMTREQTTQWLIDSPCATYMGGGWWNVVDQVRPGDCTWVERG